MRSLVLAPLHRTAFRLPQPQWTGDVQAIVRRELGRQKERIRVLTPRRVRQLEQVCQAILKQGIPSYLVSCQLPDPFGYGVFLHPDAKPLKPGDLIGIYAGKVAILPQYAEEDSLYAFEPLSHMHLTREEQKRWDPKAVYRPHRHYSLQVDAAKMGNFIRYINHSSEPNVRADLVQIPQGCKGTIASPLEVVYLVDKKILPGEQLLICYDGDDNSYWSALDIQPKPVFPTTYRLCLSAGRCYISG